MACATLSHMDCVKFCLGCERYLPVGEFYLRSASNDGLQHRCKACDGEARRANQLLARYNMTVEDYDALYDAQDGRCAICRKLPPEGRRLAVDHCHEGTGNRGLLCDACNLGLGKFGDSLEMLRAAVAYLEKYKN